LPKLKLGQNETKSYRVGESVLQLALRAWAEWDEVLSSTASGSSPCCLSCLGWMTRR